MTESDADFLARMKNEWLSQIGVIEFTNADAQRLIALAEAELAAKLEDAKRLQFLVDKPEFQIEYTGELTLREHIDAAIKEGK